MALFASRGAWWPPVSLGFEHHVEDGEQLAHRGDQRHLGWLARGAQPQVEGPQHWIAAHCADRGDVLELTRFG